MEFFFQPLSKLSNLKEITIKAFNRLKIYNYRDLLFHLPNYYIMKSIYPYLNLMKKGEVIIAEVKIDDVVMYGKWGGTEIKIDGQDLVIMKESDVVGILSK